MSKQLGQILDYLEQIPQKLIEEAQEATSIDTLRGIAVDLADRLLFEITNFAKESETPTSRVIRNLLAETSADNLCRLCYLLKIWSKDLLIDCANEIKAPLRQSSKRAKEQDFFCWLLSGGRAPSIKELLVFFGDNLLLVLVVCREIYTGRFEEDFTVKLLRAIHRVSWGIVYKSEYRSAFLSEGFRKGLPKLSEGAFNQLPVMVRKWIFSDWAFAEESLQTDFFIKVKADPYSFKDTPDYFWLKEELPLILDQLKNRNFDIQLVDRFDELLEREDVENYADQILRALRSRPLSVYYDYSTCDLDLPVKKIRLFSNQRLVQALLFFTNSVDKRIQKLPKMSDEELQELILDVSPYDFAEAIFECKSSIHLKRIKDEALKNTILKGLIFELLKKGSIFPELFKIFIRDLYKDSSAEKILSLCSLKPVAFTYWEPVDLDRPLLLNVMHKIVARPSLFVCFVNHVSDAVLNKFSVSQEDAYRNLRIELCSRACRSANKDFRFSYIRCMLSNESELVESLENWNAFNQEFDFLLKQSISSKSTELIKAVLSLVDRKGVHSDGDYYPHFPCWNSFIKKGKSVRRISRAIRKYRPDLYHSLENAEAQRLLKNTKFKKKLQSVLLGKAHAQTLGVSQFVLHHFVPWARKKWAKKPTVAVAYELALSFSIKDSRYLLYLCTKRWCSNNRFDGGKVFDHLYTTYDLPKKSGGKRTVTVPDDRLKRLQRRLLWYGFEKQEVHAASHGFVRGRSILTNAKEHLGQPLVVNIDIESFFPNTRYSHILRVCSQLLNGELSEGARRIVTDLCSYNGALPTGAPTSPAISNIVLKPVDEAVSKAATENGIVYTRYADDLTFSGKSNTPKILPFVGRVLAQYGYRIEERKTNLFRKGRRQIVTGLVVNEKPNLPRKIRRKLRAAIHVRSKDGTPHWHGKPMNDAQLVGRVSFLNLVQPEEAQKHLDTLTNNNKSTH